jgi:hypothetical protein
MGGGVAVSHGSGVVMPVRSWLEEGCDRSGHRHCAAVRPDAEHLGHGHPPDQRRRHPRARPGDRPIHSSRALHQRRSAPKPPAASVVLLIDAPTPRLSAARIHDHAGGHVVWAGTVTGQPHSYGGACAVNGLFCRGCWSGLPNSLLPVCCPNQREPSLFCQRNGLICRAVRETGATGLEPATSGVTGRSWRVRAERG